MGKDKSEKYIVVQNGHTRRPGRPKTGPGSQDWVELVVDQVISTKDFPPESIASLLDNKVIATYEGAADAPALTIVDGTPNESGGVTFTPQEPTV